MYVLGTNGLYRTSRHLSNLGSAAYLHESTSKKSKVHGSNHQATDSNALDKKLTNHYPYTYTQT